ncbi:hypothetical protein [Chryseobacterium indologenes]|uniref:O-antigen ligase domain-containing protein n=1 Tax=Chryseobacterium indologenes TaxID=253 RepID=A0A0N0IUQ4_CHRID|nr:hypothetical protein [Chryseobacterium indologenes]KPE49851.1 hypothetical protein AOB46_17980 [Chryseobacterium indologenes]
MIVIKKVPLIKLQFFFLTLLSILNVLALLYDDIKVMLYYGSLLASILLVAVSAFEMFRYRKNNLALRKNILYIFLGVWTLYISLKGFELSYDYIRSITLSPYVLLPYFLMFFTRFFRIEDFKDILKSIHIVNIFFLATIILTLIVDSQKLTLTAYIEDSIKYLCFPNFFLFLSFSKLTKKQKIISVIVFIVGFLIALMAARRSLVWIFSWTFMLFIFINYLNKNASKLKKLMLIIATLVIGFGAIIAYNLFFEALFGEFAEKLDVDTRGAVLRDFNRDMDNMSWIAGRGISGEYNLYETDYVFGLDDEMADDRNIIEAGYLNLILKGGLIYIIPFALIILIALINGIFKSKNYYLKVCSGFLILYVIEAIPAGVLMFNIRFFLVWYCIAMCWNKKVISATDQEIEKHLI